MIVHIHIQIYMYTHIYIILNQCNAIVNYTKLKLSCSKYFVI